MMPEKTEKYKFYLRADDNAGLQIKDESGVVVFRLAAEKESVQAEVKLKKNKKYFLELVYSEKTEEASIRLFWESPSFEKQAVSIPGRKWTGETDWKQSYVCFTVNDDHLYAIALEPVSKQLSFTLEKAPKEDMKVCFLSTDSIYLDWKYDKETKRLTIDTSTIHPADVKSKGAYVFKLENYMKNH